MEPNLNDIQNRPGFGEAVCTHPQDFHAFLIFTGIYIIYFPCIKNKYWLFVIQKFSVVHLFIV